MPRVKHVKANKDYPEAGIAKGEMYYRWSLMTGPRSSRTFKQKTPPKPGQLTTSEFLQNMYDIDEALQGVEEADDLDDIIQRIEDLGSETQEKFDAMPEGLQKGPTGETMTQRIEGCETWSSDLSQYKDNWPEKDNDKTDEEFKEELDAYLEEVRGCNYQGD